MASIKDLEEFQELVERFGAGAVIAATLRDLTVAVNGLNGVLGEIDASGRAMNRNLHDIGKIMANKDDHQS